MWHDKKKLWGWRLEARWWRRRSKFEKWWVGNIGGLHEIKGLGTLGQLWCFIVQTNQVDRACTCAYSFLKC